MTTTQHQYVHWVSPTYHVHLPPLTHSRLEELADHLGIEYVSDDLGVRFESDGIRFHFLLHGPSKEILIVRTDLIDDLPPYVSRKRIRDEVDRWNRKACWPKAVTHFCPGGHLHVYGELSMDYNMGVTNNQLLRHTVLVLDHARDMYDDIIAGVR